MGTHIHIRDFDSSLHEVLVNRARQRGLSLSEFLRKELTQLASKPSVEEILQRLENFPRPSIPQEVLQRAWEEARNERDAKFEDIYGFSEAPTAIKK
jgi:hypothetical protein